MKQNRRLQYFAAFAASLASMANGIAYFWSAPIMTKFDNNEIIENITKSEVAWVVTILMPGVIVGSLVGSKSSDNFGRRSVILTSAVPFMIGTVLVLCATKTWTLYIARLLWGVGVGMVTTVSGIYISEISDKDIRGSFLAVVRFMFNFGAFLTLSIGSFLSYEVLSSLLIIIPACYFLACWWIPESPYYLLKEEKVEAARRALTSFSGANDETVIEERLRLMRSDVRKEMERSSSIKELLTGKQYRRAVIVTTGLRFTQIMTGMMVIQQYLAKIIQQSNCGINISTAFVIFGSIRLFVSLTAPLLIDRVGRRPLLMISYSAASVCLTTVGSYFFVQQVIGIANETSSPFRFTVLIGLIFAKIVGNYGFDTLIYVIPSEIFPLNVRSISMIVFNVITSLIAFIAIRGFQIMEDLIGLYGVIWFYAIMALSGAVFTYVIVPETKGKSLREIQIELQGNIYDEADDKLNTIDINKKDIENDQIEDDIH